MRKGKFTYAEMLKDPRWQKKKTEILNRDNFTCQLCGDTKNTLHVHHKYYLENHKPWEYTDDALVTLCEECHSWVHICGNKAYESPIKIGDTIHYEHGDYDDYGIVFFINYRKGEFSALVTDSGIGFSDCVIYHFRFEDLNRYVEITQDFFSEENYPSTLLFYCLYGLMNDNKNVHLDYYHDDGDIDNLHLMKIKFNEMLANNSSLNNMYISAVNGNLSFLED